MRIAVALALIAVTLAGCGQGGGNGQTAAGAAGLPTPGARPSNASSDQAFRQTYRDVNITSCVRSAAARSSRGNGAPPGTDFRRYCTCAVDGSMAGLTTEQVTRMRPGPREQAIAQRCAAEMGLQTDFRSSGGQ